MLCSPHRRWKERKRRTVQPFSMVVPGVGFQNSARRSASLLRGSFVLGDKPSEHGSAVDPLVGQVNGRTVGSWRLQIEGPVRASAVVVADVLVESSAEVLFADDEQAVGDLAAYGLDESPRTPSPVGCAVGS